MLYLVTLLSCFCAQPTDDTKAMQGRWKIVTILENGKTLTEQEIATHMVADGCFTVDGMVINLLPPGQFTPKAIPFVLNSAVDPKTIDLMGTTKIGSKGIYLLSGDSLMLSLPSPKDNIRPTDFGNIPGSGRVLVVLNRVRGTGTPATVTPTPVVSPTTLPGTTTAAKPVITPAWTPVPVIPATVPVVVVTNTMDDMKRKLVGTWGHQTEDAVTYYTLNADGTFSAVVDYKEGLRNAFKEDVRSSGTWRLENGVIVVTLTTSTDKNLRGQIFSWRITNMGDRDLIAVDNQGKLRHEWKVR